MVTAILSVIINWFLTILLVTFGTLFFTFIKPIPNEFYQQLPLYAAVFMAVVVGLGAFTPLGEMWTRRDCSNKPGAELRRLQYNFDEVCSRAGTDPSAYSLYISPSKEVNAFATGKRTVVANAGFMEVATDEQIQGVLAHELGHHKLGHAFWLGITAWSSRVGAFFSTLYSFVLACVSVLRPLPLIGWSVAVLSWVFAGVFFAVRIIVTIPHNLGYFFGSRQDEYAADQFAARLGYADSLAEFLRTNVIPHEGEPAGFLAALHSTHPQTHKRVERLLNS